MKITIDDREYTLERDVDPYVAGEQIISKGLEFARKVLQMEPFREQLKKFSFRGIYLYEEKRINAFSVKVNREYLIAFSYTFFIKTYHWLMLWKKSPQIDNIFHFEDEDTKELFFENVYISIIMFVTAHEIYHILNGHCDLPEKKDCLMSEIKNSLEHGKNLFNQILEYDADFCASQFCASTILSTDLSEPIKFQAIRTLGFGIYNVFLLFNDIGEDDVFSFQMEADFSANTHPNAGIRAVYCFASLEQIMMCFWDIEQCKRISMIIVGDCITYDRVLLNHNKLKECLFTIAFTEKGAQYLMFLVNEWRSVREKLLPYSYVELREYESLMEFPVWVNDDGEFRIKR